MRVSWFRALLLMGSAAMPLAVALAGAAAAQAAPAETPVERIVVTGQGLPLPPGDPAYGAVVIGPERLNLAPSGRLENALTALAGVQQFRRSDSRSANPTAQGLSLRALGGNATSRTLVVLDGVPMTDPFFGYVPFMALAPERLAVARITRGPAAGAFGAGAVAGAVELASAGADDLPPWALSALGGSHGSAEAALGAAPRLARGFASLAARFDRSDGFQTTPPSQRVAATVPAAYGSWSAAARLVHGVAPGAELQARVLAFGDDRTLRFRGADSRIEGQDASLRFVTRAGWGIDALAYVQARDFANTVISATTFRPVLAQRETPARGAGAKIELRPPFGDDSAVRFGLDARTASGETKEDAFSGVTGVLTARRRAGGDQRIMGAFAEIDHFAGPLLLTAAIRADHWRIADGVFVERDGAGALVADTRFPARAAWEWSGRAGAAYDIDETLALRAAAYTGFRLPTLNELYRPFTVFPVTTRANAALAPERPVGAEAGIDAAWGDAASLSLTVFHNRLADAVGNVTIAASLRERRNLEAIETTGIEAAATLRLGGGWSLDASWSFADAAVDAPGTPLDGRRPAQTPRHSASATLAYDGASLSGLVTLRHTGRQFEDDLETDALAAVTTLDAAARITLTPVLSLVVRAENVFDAEVVTRNAAGSIDLGTPRTLWLGVAFAAPRD